MLLLNMDHHRHRSWMFVVALVGGGGQAAQDRDARYGYRPGVRTRAWENKR